MHRLLTSFAIFICLFAIPRELWAQFSPGELAKSHASLEGMENCTQCHVLGQKIENSKCLECHTLIKTRMDLKRGYHASAEVRHKACNQCHHDHGGRNYQMILWDPGKFNHDLTGYKLEGKHKTDRCEHCHQSTLIREPAVLDRAKNGLVLDRTYLGLSQDCQSCHFDEHRGQLKRKCEACHSAADWTQSARTLFDHQTAAYPLTGLHRSVACEKCHPTVSDPKTMPNGKTDSGYIQYVNVAADRCVTCHTDPHANRLGDKCESCHTTAGWLVVKESVFDHNRTRYPLRGLHQTVDCAKCHQPEPRKPPVYKNMAFARCQDCHVDAHAGQLSVRSDSGRCETCHDVNGFRPSLFTVAMHNTQSRYPLVGAHEKVVCEKCHSKLSPVEFRRRTGFAPTADSGFVALKFRDQRCSGCHQDIHEGQFKDKINQAGCEGCHTLTAWRNLTFNHTTDASFALQGKHVTTECGKCHLPIANTNPVRIRYKPLSASCESCHPDVHRGQFKTDATDCSPCHNAVSFQPAIFKHNLQSRFRLEGAHARVECRQCHPQNIPVADSLIVRYKPIATDCASCHPDVHEGVLEQ